MRHCTQDTAALSNERIWLIFRHLTAAQLGATVSADNTFRDAYEDQSHTALLSGNPQCRIFVLICRSSAFLIHVRCLGGWDLQPPNPDQCDAFGNLNFSSLNFSQSLKRRVFAFVTRLYRFWRLVPSLRGGHASRAMKRWSYRYSILVNITIYINLASERHHIVVWAKSELELDCHVALWSCEKRWPPGSRRSSHFCNSLNLAPFYRRTSGKTESTTMPQIFLYYSRR